MWQGGEELWQENGNGFRPVPGALRLRYSRRMSRRIAIIEDEQAIRENTADALRRQGYDVVTFADRASALHAFRIRLPDLAIIDIGLADDVDGGFALCRDARALSPALPIIFLTARDSDFDIVSGLRLGADDYLTKGTSLPHLLARIAALFRRAEPAAQPQAAEERMERVALQLDLQRSSVAWRATAVA